MSNETTESAYEITPIGKVVRTKYATQLWIKEPYWPALTRLEEFSHIVVIWWAHTYDSERFRGRVTTKPFYDKKTTTGIFATRSPVRPNPIMITTCKIESVEQEEGLVLIQNIDVTNHTPILDIKPYFSCYDKPKRTRIPKRLPKEWNQAIPDHGVGPED